MKIFVITFLLSFLTFLNASSSLGVVTKVNGSVKVKHDDSFKKSNVEEGLELKVGDLLTTSKKSNAVMKLVDGSILALDSSSTLHFSSEENVEQDSGRIFYKITSRDAVNSIKIKTPFAIIGIKGTTFIVDTQKPSIKLQEGLIGVRSIKEEYRLYRKEMDKEFNNYLSDEQKEFNEFKREEKKRVAQITKEFDLEAQNIVFFTDNVVDERALSEKDKNEFEYFESLIE